ncbi:MAG: DNA polymerase III subunit delta [Candidatus Paceibacterota bacterium]
MTIFIYGPDTYRLRQGLEQVVAAYKKKYFSGLNFFSFDLSNDEQLIQFEDSLKTTSFFEEAKLIVVRNSFASKEISERLNDFLKDQAIDKTKDIIVAVIEPLPQKELEKINIGLFKHLLSTSKTVRDFDYLKGAKLLNWIKTEFVSRNISIDTASAEFLAGLTGSESWRLANEIQKLANYKQNGVITTEDIVALVSGKEELNIFHLVDAVVSRNRTKAYELLYREIKNGRDPYYLLAMITYSFRKMLMADKSKYSPEELKNSFGKLLEIDTFSKNGATNLVDSLFEFVLVGN